MKIQVTLWLLVTAAAWGNVDVEESEADGTNSVLLNTNRAAVAMITSSATASIKIKKKTFKCKIKFVHNFDTVDLGKSLLKCSPSKPKKQKASNIEVSVDDFIFLVNVAINPSKLTKAKIISFPETTTPIPTTTEIRTTSTEGGTSSTESGTSSTGGGTSSTEGGTSSTQPFLPGTTLPSRNCTCGQANRVPRIVNGEETEINEYPWMAGLVSPGDSMVWCGGTLISSQWVMTAAHCTEESDPEDIQVLLGEHDYYDDFETRSLIVEIAKIVIHPNYDSSTVDYDFSLLRLAEPLDFDTFPHIRPICLPENLKETYEENVATVSGWGTTSSGGSLSNYLQEVEVNVLSNDECNGPEYAYDGDITDRMICANVEGGGKDSCQGDSGGPLVTQNPDLYELIGVVSWGYGCALPDAPGVYARTTTVLDWVRRTSIQSWSSCPRCEDPVDCPGSIVGPGPGPVTEEPITVSTEGKTSSTEGRTSSTQPFLPGTILPGGNCTCGQVNRVPRIVNGEETEINEYPWMAGLVSPGDSQVWCGGTLISSQWVMTAAHCTEVSDPEDIQILLGEHNYYDDFEARSLRVKVTEIVIHHNYDSSTVDYDFSLLRLAEPVDFNSFPNIRPVCLPENSEETYAENFATVSGWGTTSSGGSLSNYLQEVMVNVLSNEECNGPEYAYEGAITDRMMCANVKGGGKDSCQGDSGGPLVTQNPDLYELIGVVSWGYGCALPDAPGVYARMTKVLDWVKRTTIQSWSSCPRCEDPIDCPGSVLGPGPGPVTGEPVTVSNSSCTGSCPTASSTCQEGACVFPFIYFDRIITTCTSIDDDPIPWCATQVDRFNYMETWGYCGETCPESQDNVINVSEENEEGKCSCGVPNCEMTDNPNKIMGGTQACTGQYPWQVGVMFNTTMRISPGCGGTLVGDKYVVTAAHCTDGVDAQDINVVVGDTDLGSHKEAFSFIIGVKTIIQHERYDPNTVQNDISILELKEEVDLFTYPHIKPVCLPVRDKAYVNQDAIVSGWGTIGSGAVATSVLHEVEVNIFAYEDCGDMTEQMTEGMICAGVKEGGKDACQGDSGGPLITKDDDNNGAATLAGVVSWGVGCGVEDMPGIYSEVTYFLDWLTEKMADLNTCPPPKNSSWNPGEPCCANTMNYTLPSPSYSQFSTSYTPFSSHSYPSMSFTFTTPSTFNSTSPSNSSDCCMFNGDCIQVDTTMPRPEKCEWLSCWQSSSGPALEAYSSADSINCCLGEYDSMYQDGEEIMLTSGEMVTCCKGRWMEPSDINV